MNKSVIFSFVFLLLTACGTKDEPLSKDKPQSILSININFQKEGELPPAGYEADFGRVYGDRGNNYSYGWSSDITEGARNRNHTNSPDERFDTLVHMRHDQIGVDAYWDIALPNGEYKVRLVTGDPEYAGSYHQVYIEDLNFIDGKTTYGKQQYFDVTKTVRVTDGKLSITNGSQGMTKIAFVEIATASDTPDQVPPLDVMQTKVINGDKQAVLSWQNPLFDFEQVLVLSSTQPITANPANGTSYSAGQTIGEAKVVYVGASSLFNLLDLTNNQLLYLKIMSVDKAFNYSAGITSLAEPRALDAAQTKALDEIVMEQLSAGVSPRSIETIFNNFALSHFGAKHAAQVNELWGNELKIMDEVDSLWSHISETSAAFAWSTNLPAISHIEYGVDQTLGLTTQVSSRYFYNHLHYLTDLLPDQTYYYQWVSLDENGEKHYGELEHFITATPANVIRIPDDLEDKTLPYILEQPNTTYLLTQDINANAGAMIIKAAPITLDLGGHTINYAMQTLSSAPDETNIQDPNNSGIGITRDFYYYGYEKLEKDQAGTLKIINGKILQGDADNIGSSKGRLNPVLINNQKDIEIAGLSLKFHSPQSAGLFLRYASGEVNIHHNIFDDNGSAILDRHGGGGARSLQFTYGLDEGNDFNVHHNLVKRTRQNGIGSARRIHHNEIYVDSWSTNSFAIQPTGGALNPSDVDKYAPRTVSKFGGASVHNNKIFLTGHHAIGIAWSTKAARVHDNFIHMEGINAGKNRWYEAFGDNNSLNGLRMTSYGQGGYYRDDLQFFNNVIVGNARHGSNVRGTELFSDSEIYNTVVSHSNMTINDEDPSNDGYNAQRKVVSSINVQGVTKKTNPALILRDKIQVEKEGKLVNCDDLPLLDKSSLWCILSDDERKQLSHQTITYDHLILSSNTANIRFGDYYGVGDNALLTNVIFKKVGNNPNYHTIVFDGGYWSDGHVIRDAIFEEGTAYDDVFWRRTGSYSAYSIEWTLSITPQEGDGSIEIFDKNDDVVFEGRCNGEPLRVPLKQSEIRPLGYLEHNGSGDSHKHEELMHTPHKVIIKNTAGEIIREICIFMDAAKELNAAALSCEEQSD